MRVTFHIGFVEFTVYSRANYRLPFKTTISSEAPDWLTSDMVHALSQFSATLRTVVHLELVLEFEYIGQLYEAVSTDWLHLLHQVPALKVLYVSRELAGPVAFAPEDVAEMVAAVLPFLDLVCLVDQPPSSIERVIAARRFSDHPITFVNTSEEFDESLHSYVSR